MRLLVCGSRNWPGEDGYYRVADEIRDLAPSLVMHGGAKGADECADLWCRTPPAPVPLLVFRADWHHNGKSAGPLRNARMLRDGKPDRGLAFGALYRETNIRTADGRDPRGPGWPTTGTGDMVQRMLRAGLPVRWVATPDAVAVDLTEMPAPTGREAAR